MTEETDPLAAAAAEAAEKPAENAHPILSAEDVEAAKAKARQRVEAERRKTAMKAIEDEETQRLNVEEGLHTGDQVKDELVNLTLDLAEHSSRISLSGRLYFHGQTYTVARHIADTLREIQARGWQHQQEIDGKPMYGAFRKPHETILSGARGITNAPSAAA